MQMVLNLQALSYIVEVSKNGSISKASQNLFLSQPHLSNTIKAVEKEIGITIFRRSARGMTLTDDGKVFIKKAQQILSQIDDLESMFFMKPSESIRLNLSITRSYQVSRCINRFINQNTHKKQFLLRVKETNPFEVMDDVRRQIADFGVLHFFEPQLDYFINCFKTYGLTYDKAYDRPFLLAMSADNPLAQLPELSKELLQDQIMVAYGDYEAPSASYQVVNDVSDIIMSKKRIYVYDRCGAMGTLCSCPNTYMWITGLHSDTLKHYNLVLRKCKGVTIRNIGFRIYTDFESLSPAARSLLADLRTIDWTEDIQD